MATQAHDEVLTRVRAALEHEPRVNLHRYPLAITRDQEGMLVVEGETANIAAKKVALEIAAATPGVAGIIDRLRVVPARRMSDAEIRDHVRDTLLGEPAFEHCAIRVETGEQLETVREPLSRSGDCIELSVADGVVTLDGMVPSLSHKSLAGALVWWVPGSRDVVNGLEVAPPQEINDAEITEAVRLVLEKDPLLNPDPIRAITRNSIVVLEGYATNQTEKEMAEMDAWYVFGVDMVINRLQVRQ